MSRSFLRNIAVTLSTLLIAGAMAAPHPHFASTTNALSQLASNPGGGDPTPPCDPNDCIVRAM